MAIRTRSSDGYQQVELTSELLHSQSGTTQQQVISTVPCTKHLPFFLSILLADVFLFGSILLFSIYSTQYSDGFGFERSLEFPQRQFNLHALIMLVAFIYLNGQAITVYKSNYLIKHKSINMLYHFLLHLLTICGIVGGIYLTYEAQETIQEMNKRTSDSKVAHFYSVHSWTGLIAIGLFTIQFLFGFFSFFVTLCCRKLTARMRAKALPVHRMFAMIVLCASVSTVISGLSQLARFQLNGLNGHDNYKDLTFPALLINLTAVCVLAATVLIFFITFIYKRRQAHDLPVLFKIILLVTQFIEFILILVVAEFIFQLVTPHVNRVINGQFLANTTITHIFNNATNSINSFISQATQQLAGSGSGGTTTATTSTTLAPSASSSESSITLGVNITRA